MDSFRLRRYIPNRCTDSLYFKIGLIIICISVISIMVAALTSTFSSSNEGKLAGDRRKLLILSGGDRYYNYNLTSKTISNGESFNDSVVGSFEFYGVNNFFWYNVNHSTINRCIFQTVLSNNSPNGLHGQLFADKRVKVRDMAYDHIGENLYVIDQLAGTLIVIDVWSEKYESKFNILLPDLLNPHDIQLDPERGVMFILQSSDSILRSSMDGTSLKQIVESKSITAMTVDTSGQRVYWADNENGIVSSDYEGKDLAFSIIDTFNIVDMAFANDELFWIWETHSDKKLSHHLLSCGIKNGICVDEQPPLELDNLGEFVSMKVTEVDPRWDASEKNPCSKENHPCQHLCLISSSGKPSCACKLGWQLDLDQKTCKQTMDMLIYTVDGYFRSRVLDTFRSVEPMLPTPYKVNGGYGMAFDYDIVDNILYFCDRDNIYTMRLGKDWSGQSILVQGNNDTHFQDIAYDYLTDNLYYLENLPKEGYKIQVFKVRLGIKYKRTIVKQEDVQASSIAFYSELGYLAYHSVKMIDEKRKGTIHLATANGTELFQTLDRNYLNLDTSFSIDNTDRRIYWIPARYDNQIISTNFTGNDFKFTTIDSVKPLVGVLGFRKWLLVGNYHNIYRVEKSNPKNVIKLVPSQKSKVRTEIMNAKIFSKTLGPRIAHPCNDRNGGCEQICFVGGNEAVCDCRDGDVLDSHGHCVIVS